MIPVYLDHIPAGTSTRPIVHYAQLHENDNQFKKYDYGNPDENIAHYGTPEPPEYDLSKVTAPVGIFAGDNDNLVAIQDAEYLSTLLPNLFHFEVLDYPKCSHFDFAIGIDAGEKIYKPIFEMMENF
jgi:lysosomal acid lipase/cholesteryl ester hydrolase